MLNLKAKGLSVVVRVRHGREWDNNHNMASNVRKFEDKLPMTHYRIHMTQQKQNKIKTKTEESHVQCCHWDYLKLVDTEVGDLYDSSTSMEGLGPLVGMKV